MKRSDDDMPVAEIVPVVGGDPLARGIDEGWIRPPLRSGVVGHHVLARASHRVPDVLAKDRSE
jgi:hypothetical protein